MKAKPQQQGPASIAAALAQVVRGRTPVHFMLQPPAVTAKVAHVYRGERDINGAGIVYVDAPHVPTYDLPIRHDLRQHAPAVDWGYSGRGPAQLALALLAHVAGDEMAADWYQDFKEDVVAGMPHEGWEISEERIESWLESRLRRGDA